MNFDSKQSKAYISKIAGLSRCPQLGELAADLLGPAREFPEALTPANVQIVTAREQDLLVIEQMIKVAYHWRYCGADGAKLSNFSEISTKPGSHTLVAKAVSADKKHELILATLRLVGQDLELFTFFHFTDPQQHWPHEKKHLTPYEVERLAFHPVFEIVKNPALQLYITQQFQVAIRALISEPNYWLGCTVRSNVKKFLDKAGIRTTEIPGLEFSHNEYTDFLVDLFPNYFQDFYAYEIN